ncbi:MAG: isochorismatase family protein [Bacillota bacterium]|uniref:nicotinamidase n=1 Tax=Symbiobacterium thermophilum TaxID=2734 RepID=A0A1Y2T7K8_SYMTR|nr:MAG: hypothetical protein A6D92_03765 [Symbiobacterium thermophilum]PZN73875.1 MAG: hypothetical protein DIU55_01800 [Bacillota bacterium]
MAKRALFVIDTQVDFNDEQGSLTSFRRSDPKMQHIADLMEEVHREGGFVVATLDTHPPLHHPEHLVTYRRMLQETLGPDRFEAYMDKAFEAYREELKLYPPHCEYGTPGWQPTAVIRAAFERLGDDVILIQKPTYRLVDGCVMKGPAALIGRTGVQVLEFLKGQGVQEVIVSGLITPVCVLAAAESAVGAGFRVTVDERLVDSYDEESHRQGLERIAAAGGIVVPAGSGN